jgi:hypothetical protein
VKQAENHEEKPWRLMNYTRWVKQRDRAKRRFSMGRDVGKYISVEILDSHHVIDLTHILNLVALILSMILCLLLFQAF